MCFGCDFDLVGSNNICGSIVRRRQKLQMNGVVKKMSFGERLRNARKDKGLSQAKLARISGVSVQSIRCYESGAVLPTITLFEWLVKALETTSSELLGF